MVLMPSFLEQGPMFLDDPLDLGYFAASKAARTS